MSLKLLAPLTGIAGTIVSVVGFSNFNTRPEKPSNTNPTHKWKINIPENVDMALDCTGYSFGAGLVRRSVNAILKLRLPPMTWDKGEELLERGEFIGDVFIELLDKNGSQRLWPVNSNRDEKTLWLIRGEAEGTLKVSLGQKQSVIMWISGEHKVDFVTENTELVCRNGKLVDSGQAGIDTFYEGESAKLKQKLSGTVQISQCFYGEGGALATCDLKLTVGTNLNWSAEISTKAKFTII